MNFVPADFQLALLFCSGLRVRHGTDGRTDKDRQRLMSSPMAAGHNQAINTAKATWVRSVCRWKFYLSQMQIFIKRIIVLFFLKMDQIDTHHKIYRNLAEAFGYVNFVHYYCHMSRSLDVRVASFALPFADQRKTVQKVGVNDRRISRISWLVATGLPVCALWKNKWTMCHVNI